MLRVARGRDPQTFYRDSYDYPVFRQVLLDAFRSGEPIVPAEVFLASSQPLPSMLQPPGADCVQSADRLPVGCSHRAEAPEQPT